MNSQRQTVSLPKRRTGGAISQDAGATPSTAVTVDIVASAESCAPAQPTREIGNHHPPRMKHSECNAVIRRMVAEGATRDEIAAAIGRSVYTVSRRAASLGLSLRPAAMRRLWGDPEYRTAATRRARWATEKPERRAHLIAAAAAGREAFSARKAARLAALTDSEREDYGYLCRNGYRVADALRAIGRADLIGGQS